MAEITNKRLKELEQKERKLQALENGGVDDWEWYDEAMKEYRKYIEKEEKLNNVVIDICETVCEYIEQPAGSRAGYGLSIDGQKEIEQIIRQEYL